VKHHKFSLLCAVLALGALSAPAALAQAVNSDIPRAPAEDPAYLEHPESKDRYTEERTVTEEQEIQADAVRDDYRRSPASSDEIMRDQQPSYLERQPQPQTQPQAQPNTGAENRPSYLNQEMKAGERTPATAAGPGTSEAESESPPSGTQNAFFEITPTLGSISIKDKAAFTVGTNLSFNIVRDMPLYLEPSVYLSFFNGQNDTNTTIFHIDAGLRYDIVIGGSPVVPFVKAAVGPSLSSSSNVVAPNGDTISDSYINMFAGGGLKLLINPRVSARLDTGVTFQGTDPGLYVLGAAAIPL
jgi:hypothetical protein